MFGGRCERAYNKAMVETAIAFTRAGITFEHGSVENEAHIERARNECFARFLASRCSHLFFVDADIGFLPQDAYNSLASGFDFVLGAYRKKNDSGEWTVTLRPEDIRAGRFGVERRGAARFLRCHTGGAGFMCLARSVAEKLSDGQPEYIGGPQAAPIRCKDVFRSRIHAGKKLGEDTDLCLRWGELGGEVWCNLDAKLVHVGSKAYEGNFAGLFSERGPEAQETAEP
jgi:hypothetical protein